MYNSRGIKYIHNVVQLSPLSIWRTCSSFQTVAVNQSLSILLPQLLITPALCLWMHLLLNSLMRGSLFSLTMFTEVISLRMGVCDKHSYNKAITWILFKVRGRIEKAKEERQGQICRKVVTEKVQWERYLRLLFQSCRN